MSIRLERGLFPFKFERKAGRRADAMPLEEQTLKNARVLEEAALDVAKVNYEQERARADKLMGKADNAVKSAAAAIAVMSFLGATLGKTSDVPAKLGTLSIILGIIDFLVLLLTIYFAIRVQGIKQSRLFPKGEKFFEETLNETFLLKTYSEAERFLVKKKRKLYDASSHNENVNNQDRVKALSIAYCCLQVFLFLTAIILLLVAKEMICNAK